MASFGVYLASVSTPIAQRVLTGLGIGIVTYVGLDVVMTQVKDAVVLQWGQIPAGALTLMSLAGVSQGVGIVLAALATRFSMMKLSSLGRIL